MKISGVVVADGKAYFSVVLGGRAHIQHAEHLQILHATVLAACHVDLFVDFYVNPFLREQNFTKIFFFDF